MPFSLEVTQKGIFLNLNNRKLKFSDKSMEFLLKMLLDGNLI